jgi:prepilin-type N-terminal cleavage/methylation domain-containing protein
MKKMNKKNGFTLIELIIVMVILGIMAAVAVPRYLDSISNAEKSAEDAVISAIRSGLKQAANDSLYTNGRASWPSNPFDALVTKPQSYSLEGTPCDEDNEWTFVVDASDGAFTGYISHQRADNSRFQWNYNKGINTGTDNDATGTLYKRSDLGTGGTEILFK